jgi:hypothetical protein
MFSKLPKIDEEAIQRIINKYSEEFFEAERERIKTPEDYASFIKNIVESYLTSEAMAIGSIRNVKAPIVVVYTVQHLLPRLSRVVEIASKK